MQLEHDAAHRIAEQVLRLVAYRFSDEELVALYRSVMGIAVQGVREYTVQRNRQLARLCGMPDGTSQQQPDSSPMSDRKAVD